MILISLSRILPFCQSPYEKDPGREYPVPEKLFGCPVQTIGVSIIAVMLLSKDTTAALN